MTLGWPPIQISLSSFVQGSCLRTCPNRITAVRTDLTAIAATGMLRSRSKSKPRHIISWHRAAPLPCPPAKAGRRNGAAASPELSQESTGALNRELAARTLRCRTFFLDRIARSGVR